MFDKLKTMGVMAFYSIKSEFLKQEEEKEYVLRNDADGKFIGVKITDAKEICPMDIVYTLTDVTEICDTLN